MSMRDGALRVALDGLQNLVERLKRELAEMRNRTDTTSGEAQLAPLPALPVAFMPWQGTRMRRLWAALRGQQ